MAWTQTYTAKDSDGTAYSGTDAGTVAYPDALENGGYWEANGDWTFTAEGGSQADYTADAVNNEAGNESSLELLRQEQAAAAGVRDARYVGYAEVLANYNSRSDTEPLADRRARELAVDAGQQSFTRDANYTGDSATTQTEYPESGNWTEANPES